MSEKPCVSVDRPPFDLLYDAGAWHCIDPGNRPACWVCLPDADLRRSVFYGQAHRMTSCSCVERHEILREGHADISTGAASTLGPAIDLKMVGEAIVLGE